MAVLGIGATAPDFNLPRDGGGRVSLADFRGKPLVLFFYPKDDTTGCTAESLAFTALADEFDAAGAAVVGMSPDSVKCHDTLHQEIQPFRCARLGRGENDAAGLWRLEGKEHVWPQLHGRRAHDLPDPHRRYASPMIWQKVKVPGHAEEVLEGPQEPCRRELEALSMHIAARRRDRGHRCPPISIARQRLAQESCDPLVRSDGFRCVRRCDAPLPDRPGRPDKADAGTADAGREALAAHRQRSHRAAARDRPYRAQRRRPGARYRRAVCDRSRCPIPSSTDGCRLPSRRRSTSAWSRAGCAILAPTTAICPRMTASGRRRTRPATISRRGLPSCRLILEARGLDVTPSLQAKMRETGDLESAAVLDVIYNDEKGHVAIGAKWFRFLCARERRDPAADLPGSWCAPTSADR